YRLDLLFHRREAMVDADDLALGALLSFVAPSSSLRRGFLLCDDRIQLLADATQALVQSCHHGFGAVHAALISIRAQIPRRMMPSAQVMAPCFRDHALRTRS